MVGAQIAASHANRTPGRQPINAGEIDATVGRLMNAAQVTGWSAVFNNRRPADVRAYGCATRTTSSAHDRTRSGRGVLTRRVRYTVMS